MLDLLVATVLAFVAPQGRAQGAAEAVAVRGDAELSPAEAFSSARRKAEDHVRDLWQARVEREAAVQRPFWVPAPLASLATRRWLGGLPYERLLRVVDREDQERTHEFGNSYQTTLWVMEEPALVEQAERQLRHQLRSLERTTAMKYGGIVGGWVVLGVMIGWLDRLSRGYMTGRLRLLGLLAAAAIPTVTFLV